LRQGTLVARAIDLEREELTGEPVTLADRVSFDATFGLGALATNNELA
jgi:hypothetical protein